MIFYVEPNSFSCEESRKDTLTQRGQFDEFVLYMKLIEAKKTTETFNNIIKNKIYVSTILVLFLFLSIFGVFAFLGLRPVLGFLKYLLRLCLAII